MKNNQLALAQNPRQFARTLREIQRDLALIPVGWSGQWDTALIALLKTPSARTYPVYQVL